MSSEAPDLQRLIEQLARFEEQAWRVPPTTAAMVRAVLAEQITHLGGAVPDGVDLDAHPSHRAARRRAELEGTESAPPTGTTLPAIQQDFDFDRGASVQTASEINVTPSRLPRFDRDNPQFEDLSKYDLEPLDGPLQLANSERTDGGSLAFQLDDVAPPDPPPATPADDEAPKEADGQISRLVVHAGSENEEVLDLDQEDEISFGRGKGCTFRLKDARASRLHCRLFAKDASWWIEDLGSANGTLVNGEFLPARSPRHLTGGEEIVVGSSAIRFEADSAPSPV